jgi:hypothetical protein
MEIFALRLHQKLEGLVLASRHADFLCIARSRAWFILKYLDCGTLEGSFQPAGSRPCMACSEKKTGKYNNEIFPIGLAFQAGTSFRSAQL